MNLKESGGNKSGVETDFTPLFRALVVRRHKRALTDNEFLQLLKAHVRYGFALIKNDSAGFKSKDDYADYLVELARAFTRINTDGKRIKQILFCKFFLSGLILSASICCVYLRLNNFLTLPIRRRLLRQL